MTPRFSLRALECQRMQLDRMRYGVGSANGSSRAGLVGRTRSSWSHSLPALFLLFFAVVFGFWSLQWRLTHQEWQKQKHTAALPQTGRQHKMNAKCKGKERVVQILERAIQYAVDGTCRAPLAPPLHRRLQHVLDGVTGTNRSSILTRRTSLPRRSASHTKRHVYGLTTCHVPDVCDQLPQWKQVTQLYGERPVVLGLDTCARYRAMLRNTTTPTPRLGVTGLYNSGTNALMAALLDNAALFPHVHTRGTNETNETAFGEGAFEVPWGKHLAMDQIRYDSLTSSLTADEQSKLLAVLPIVIVRDPFRWMKSMCKMNYDAEWMKVPHGHCPNLVPIPTDWDTLLRPKPVDQSLATYPVTVRTSRRLNPLPNSSVAVDVYDSLADLWTTFYKDYIQADFPRLIVRFEDLLFHREYVLSQISHCVTEPSVSRNPPKYSTWKYRVTSAKDHGPLSQFDLVSGVIQYGTSRGRYAGMANEDVRYAAHALDPSLLRQFHYQPGPTI